MGYKLLLISFRVLLGIVFLSIGALQFAGTWMCYTEVLEWNVIVSAIALVVTAPIPVIGTVLSIIGCTQVFGWSVGFTIFVYVALYAIYFALIVVNRAKGPYWESKAYDDPSLIDDSSR